MPNIAPQTTFLNNIFRHLNGRQNPMDSEAVVRAQGGMFGQNKTLRIEERQFNYKVQDSGQEYKFFLVVRECDKHGHKAACDSLLYVTHSRLPGDVFCRCLTRLLPTERFCGSHQP